MNNIEPYVKRPVQFLQQVSSEDRRIKVYGISAKSESLPEALVSEGIKSVLPHLPQPALAEQRYGAGFLIVHQGTMRNWFLLDWWEYEDILFHRLFSSPLDESGSITAEPDRSVVACVHELRIINFESEAWIKAVLRKDCEPNFDEYLKLKFDGDGLTGRGHRQQNSPETWVTTCGALVGHLGPRCARAVRTTARA